MLPTIKMKALIIYIILIFPSSIFAQIDLINNDLTDPNIRFLYRGIDNHIKFIGINKDTTLSLTSSSGKVIRSKWEEDVFFVRVRILFS